MELSLTNKPFILKDIPFCEKKKNRSKDFLTLFYFIFCTIIEYHLNN